MIASENATGLHLIQESSKRPSGAGRWQACRRVLGHLYLTCKQVVYRSPVGNDLVSQGCPTDDPAVVGRPRLGYFHLACVNRLGFSDILAACPNRSLVRESRDRGRVANAFRSRETGHGRETAAGVNPLERPKGRSRGDFGDADPARNLSRTPSARGGPEKDGLQTL